jgi:hypothetical protein
MHDIANIYATGSNASGYKNWRSSSTESPHRSFTLHLSTVTVNRGDRELHVPQEVVKKVNLLSAVCKNNGADTMHFVQKLEQHVLFVLWLGFDDELSNICSSAASATDPEPNVGCC